MADYGFRLTRDACGKNSTPKTITRSWDIIELRKIMKQKVNEEIAELSKKDIEAHAISNSSVDVVEVRDKFDNQLISYYEIEEFEHQ